jgi:hypothetical protein
MSRRRSSCSASWRSGCASTTSATRLLIWPTVDGTGTAFGSVGPALWTFGSPDAHGFFETAVLDTAAMAGLITITLQIAYLPALHAEPAPGAAISLTYDEFFDAVVRLREVDFPIEREPEAAWPHFVGWRVNYEQAAYRWLLTMRGDLATIAQASAS